MQISSKNIDHGAIALASGQAVTVIRQPAGRRALFIFEDSPKITELIDAYERREPLPIPAKAIINARTELFHQAKRVSLEGV